MNERKAGAVAAGFREPRGQAPRDCTCWVALSEATPDNGCLYFLPRCCDPAYAVGDCTDAALGGSEAPRQGTFHLQKGPHGGPVYMPTSDDALRHIRAVPCHTGDAVFFSHRIVHWGSQGRVNSVHGPRISLSFAGSDHSFRVAEPYFDPGLLPLPPHSVRVALASAQMLCYAGNGRFNLSGAECKAYRQAFRAQRAQFNKQYRSTVRQAFRSASELAKKRGDLIQPQKPQLTAKRRRYDPAQ